MAPIEGLWPRLDSCSEQFNRMTVHRASFREWPCSDRTLPEVQCDHKLVGGSQEPVQNVTWQKHDFVAKCLPEAERQRSTGSEDGRRP
ncbi:unnamed protein product [Macrosiphum euphorbiae]|uniref:Uncharacterized protein n=1 Tax=Macrosiphum euphorbiae TaxID=13131 RepID=A0AAV0XRP3_9HEMI|nr:unnamed protein product [Macrosiphum euphorbiae]